MEEDFQVKDKETATGEEFQFIIYWNEKTGYIQLMFYNVPEISKWHLKKCTMWVFIEYIKK